MGNQTTGNGEAQIGRLASLDQGEFRPSLVAGAYTSAAPQCADSGALVVEKFTREPINDAIAELDRSLEKGERNARYWKIFTITLTILLFSVGIFLLTTQPGLWVMLDLQVYRAGASALLHGRDIYQSHPPGSGLPFTYPPFAALAFVPLAIMNIDIARLTMTALSVASILIVVAICFRDANSGFAKGARHLVPIAAISAATIFLEPFRETIRFGQINAPLLALVLLDVVAWKNRPRWLPRGVLIGIATGIKLTPGIFIAYLFVTKQIRAAIISVLTMCGTILFGLIVATDSTITYWTNLVFDDRRIGGIAYPGNQSLRGTITRLMGSPEVGKTLWMASALFIAIAGLSVSRLICQRGDALLSAGICGITGLLVSPVSWSHHWVWALPVGLILGMRGLQRRSPWLLMGSTLWIGLFYLAPIWWVPNTNDREYDHHGWQLIFGNSYVLAGLVVLLIPVLLPAVRRLYSARASSITLLA